MSKLPQIAVIGHGAWGRNHARILRELGALRWVYDADPAALVDVPERTSFVSKIWEDKGTAGVVIATPPATHGGIARDAILSGKAVLIEKPMATTVVEAKDIACLAHAHSVPLMVGHTMLYHSGFVKMLAQVHRIGRIEYVYSHRLQPGRVRSDSSSLWQLAPHDVSMLIAVAGVPSAVSCVQGVSRAGLADIVTATLEWWAAGAQGHFFVSWLHPAKTREFYVIGEHGALTFEQDPLSEPLRIELEHFLDCIRQGYPPRTGAEDGIEVVRVLEACERSMAREGAKICLTR